MTDLSKYLWDFERGQVGFHCPGCKTGHVIAIAADETRPGGPVWGYNGDPEAPTFTPSILVRSSERLTEDERRRVLAGEKIQHRPTVCHSFVTAGQIQFLSDCTHALAGQTVPLVEWPSWEE